MDRSPHKSGFVNANGVRLHYLDWGGSGDALLFLAGMGCNAHIFDDFPPRFTDRFRVLALTRRGHGESDHPETGYDVDTLTEDIRIFLNGLGIEQVILVGHSMANVELSHFSALYPDRVLKLVFLDAAYDRTSVSYKDMVENSPWKHIQPPALAFFALSKGINTISDEWMTDAQKAEILKHVETRENLWTRESIEIFLHNVPHARIVEIPKGHHYCFIEQEELVYQEMRRFLLD